MPTEESLAKARTIVRESLVWDNHSCMPLRPEDTSFLPELAGVRAAGTDVISLNIGFGPQSPDEHEAMLASFSAWVGARDDQFQLVRTLDDVDAAKASGRLGVMFDVEGMYPLNGGRIDLVETFRRGGVGWMLIAYNNANDAGGGCVDPDQGLTGYGREVLAEMKRVGMMVCCSHTGHRTAMEVMESADNPVIFSHSNASALFAHYRNIPDEMILACAETGGVVGVNGLGHFLSADGRAMPEHVAAHIDHIAERVGADHVAIGLDYVFDRQELIDFLAKMRATFPDDGAFQGELDMLHPTRIDEVTACLVEKGYTRADLEKILGGNWRRVAAAVWR
ncbi:dipeptidase [Phenylobacterium sp.]|jgi:membrane dipeptidase|uniref:dipeptidase n=1 Tax=Phenylobacterium sp. TaxID=1871053 RepID=UPI0037CC9B76